MPVKYSASAAAFLSLLMHSPAETATGEELEDWTVYPLPVEPLPGHETKGLGVELLQASEIEGSQPAQSPASASRLEDDVVAGPAFFTCVTQAGHACTVQLGGDVANDTGFLGTCQMLVLALRLFITACCWGQRCMYSL